MEHEQYINPASKSRKGYFRGLAIFMTLSAVLSVWSFLMLALK